MNGQVCSLSDLPVNLRNGLVTMLPFCNSLIDISKTPSTLLSNNVTFGTDRFGNSNSAAQFNRANSSYLFIPAVAKFEKPSFTISLWFKTNLIMTGGGPGQKDQSLLAYSPINWNVANAAFGIELTTADNSILQSNMWTSTTFNQYISTNSSVINNSSWFHIALVYDGVNRTQKLYLNGTLYSSRLSGVQYNGQSGLSIGATKATASGNFGAFFDGLIDDVGFWNRALSDSEIVQLNNNYSTSVFPDLSLNNVNINSSLFINNSIKKFNIYSYLERRYIGHSSLNWLTKGVSDSTSKIKSYYTSNSICYYEEIIANDYKHSILGYNVFGSFLIDGASHDGFIGRYIEDPHLIDIEGNVIFENKILLHKFEILEDTVGIVFTPESYINTFLHRDKDKPLSSNFLFGNSPIDIYLLSDNLKLKQKLMTVSFNNQSFSVNDLFPLISQNNLDTKKLYFIFSTDSDKRNNLGLIDGSGRIICNPEFSKIVFLKNSNNVSYFLVNNGYDPFDKIGIVKSDGEYLYEPNFEEMDLWDFEKNPKSKAIIKYDRKFGLIDSSLNIFIDPIYYNLTIINDNIAIVEKKFEYNNKWDILNIKTKKLKGLNSDSDISSYFLQGLSEIPFEQNNKWGYCNRNGEIIIAAKYDEVTPFTEGLAFAISYKYGTAILGVNSFSIINKSGIVVSNISNSISNDIASINNFSDGLAAFKSKKSRLYGYLNKMGEIAIPPQFEEASFFRGGKAQVKRYGTHYSIDRKGNRIN